MTRTILMFSGQGSQSVGMGKEIAQEFREFAQTLEEASDHLGYSMKALLWEDAENQLNLTEFTQPAILTMSTALSRVLRERAGVQPELVAGHSLGEYSALVAAGALRFEDALKAVRFRGQSMQKAVPVGVGGMAAYIGAQCDAVEELCRTESLPGDSVEPVNFNSPSQLVLSGHKSAVERVAKIIGDRKLGKARLLPVSAPFHSSLMKPAAEAMSSYLAGIALSPLSCQLVANVDAQIYEKSAYTREHLVKQIASPVLWTQTLRAVDAIAPDTALWIEVGPGAVLQGLLKQTLANREALGTANAEHLKATLSKF
jgi:[acyl-carrier-protein] S-malonyltransferase